ncbi:hypothetical protein BFJ65_g15129 [Fusarium oxysporum f. sp. cepae]|uniref:Uncharacterized protein n=1 Tax=Fusarium oxysporum f. sp. cepae TaxID=396571 RepID=A0A3L6N0G3_FUSOX|nr:hypothetical protein BFJ65_g15129 [Fusarium oxysporum f. sp. cepae]
MRTGPRSLTLPSADEYRTALIRATTFLSGKKLKRRLKNLDRRHGPSDDAKSDKQPQRPTKSKRSPSAPMSRKSQSAAPSKPVVSPGRFTAPIRPTAELLFPRTYDE